MYNTIIRVVLNGTPTSVPSLTYNGKVYSDDTEKANILNNFFVDITNDDNKTGAPP